MTWGWDARGALPAVATGLNTTAGGGVGAVAEARQTAAWPRYEAEYLKRALKSEQYKYDTDGLDEAAKAVYLDKIVANYKSEADEVLKGEFEQWLQGQHGANDLSVEQLYENADGKPVRKWLMRTPESQDVNGNYKVGQARAGWKHTPWGRAPLTHLPGVRDYLRDNTESAQRKDMEMQFLAEFGPQNIEQAWMYFKHWVKGRPLSDAVAPDPRFAEPSTARTVGDHIPERMYAYDSEPSDRQPGVFATDTNAFTAAVAKPGDVPKQSTTISEDRAVEQARELRERMEEMRQTWGLTESREQPAAEFRAKEEGAKRQEVSQNTREEKLQLKEEAVQEYRRVEVTAPTTELLPAIK